MEKEENEHNIFHQKDRVLFRKLKLQVWVPTGPRSEICETKHDTTVASHMGKDKTRQLTRRNVWWPSMNEENIKDAQNARRTRL
jgi:hypothetical protein